MTDEKVDDRADAYFDHRLDLAGLNELEVRLRADADYRAWFANQCRREVALRAVIRLQHQVRTVTAGSARLRRRRPRPRTPNVRWLVAAGIMVAIALVVGAALVPNREPALGKIVTASAGTRSAATARLLAEGDELHAGEEVSIGASATVYHRPSGARSELTGPGRFTIADDGLSLLLGKTVTELPHQEARDFRIRTPHAEIVVVGTRFAVDVGAERTTVAVFSGVVEMRTAGGVRRLAPGETASWPALPPTPAPPPPQAPTAHAVHADSRAKPVAGSPGQLVSGVRGVVLFDPDSGPLVSPGEPLHDGTVVALVEHPCALRAVTSIDVVSVRFHITGPDRMDERTLEGVVPFVFPGDDDFRVYKKWQLVRGSYIISVQAYADVAGRIPLGPKLTLSLSVE